LKNYFRGTAEETKHFLKFKDCNQNWLKIKYETEKKINKKDFFEKKWVLTPIQEPITRSFHLPY